MGQTIATDVWVTGMSLCSALGPTLAQSWQMLLRGTCGLNAQTPYKDLPSYYLGTIAGGPATLTPLLERALRDVMADARLPEAEGDRRTSARWGFAIGSSRGYQADLELLMGEHQGNASDGDARWLHLYGRSPAVEAARQLQRSGPVLSPRAACATGIWAIAQGIELIRSGQCDVVIAGAAEAPITPLTLAGFQNMGALAKTGAFPFDRRRTGFVLGEGAALLVLERRDRAERRGAIPYGRVLGFGLTNDAYHCSAPAPDRIAGLSAVRDCLARSDLRPAQVGYIHAHGTGTALNDEREAAMIRELFPLATTAVSSTKGATGHTLGASGALGSVFCLMALYEQILPPCVGLVQPAYNLDWVLQARPAALDAALCLSFGFGGQNAAIAFARSPDRYS
ncbi:beta-ketoacyl-ACP synthase [Altericista sp. CCNU0014]|uniref:beta-ketoacyl-ACP synthase n=1 Tax=Altericista sp. CCNU0014 TaxID=3082949 RepID=UPI00384EF7F0